MSSQASILPLIVSLAEFAGALIDLHRARQELKQLKTTDGQVHNVEFTFDDGVGRQAGLEKTEKGFQIVTDCHGLTKDQLKKQAESVEQIVQRYSYRKVIAELQAQGYVVAEEEKRGDNSIRLVVRKWS